MTIILQALAEAHIPTILEACADWPELAQYGPPCGGPRSSAELRRKIVDTAGPQPATAYSFVLADSEGRLVGEVSIHAIDWRSRVAQVGICIWRPSDRGQGYGAAGSRAVIDWAVGHLGLHRLEAWVLASNGASLGLFRSLGFVEEGRPTQRHPAGGADDLEMEVDVHGEVRLGGEIQPVRVVAHRLREGGDGDDELDGRWGHGMRRSGGSRRGVAGSGASAHLGVGGRYGLICRVVVLVGDSVDGGLHGPLDDHFGNRFGTGGKKAFQEAGQGRHGITGPYG